MESKLHDEQDPPKATLCESCRNIFVQEQQPEDGKLFPHHANRGCLDDRSGKRSGPEHVARDKDVQAMEHPFVRLCTMWFN